MFSSNSASIESHGLLPENTVPVSSAFTSTVLAEVSTVDTNPLTEASLVKSPVVQAGLTNNCHTNLGSSKAFIAVIIS
ncbi:MAG: hypothetical protein ACTSRG_14625 [Candidatus Helarchaeota archaeon]